MRWVSVTVIIYEVHVTVENVELLIHKELCRLLMKYGRRVKDVLYALALGPNAYKVWNANFRAKCRIQDVGRNLDEACLYQDVRIICGPLPFVIPLFTDNGWHYAHEEAKRISSLTGGIDA